MRGVAQTVGLFYFKIDNEEPSDRVMIMMSV